MNVLEGFVPSEEARSEYGVALKPAGHPYFCEVDAEATKKLRAERMKGG